MTRVVLWGRRLQEVALYVLLVMLPFSKAAVEIGFGLLAVPWFIERCYLPTRAQTCWRLPILRPVLWAVGAFVGISAVSIAVSAEPGLSIDGFVGKWLEYLLYLLIVADVAGRPRVLERGVWAAAGGIALVLVEVMSQYWLGHGLLRGYPLSIYGRGTGPYENPIDLATYLMVVLPWLAAALIVAGRGWPRWLAAVLCVGGAAAFVQADALGAWLGLASGLLVLAVWDVSARRYGKLALLTVTVVGGVALAVTGQWQRLWAGADSGVTDRWLMWRAALDMIQDRPWFGHGVNTFMANYLNYWVGGEHAPRYAHNCYLQVAAETGLLGLGAFLVMLAALGWRWFAALRRTGQQRWWLSGLVAGLVAFMVQAGIDTNFYALRQAALFWVLAGAGLGWSIRMTSDSAGGA